MSRITIPSALPTAPAPSATSRRRLLAGSGLGAALALIGLPATATSPDATLFAACHAFDQAVLALDAVPEPDWGNALEDALMLYHERYEAVSALRPATLAGLRAKAAVVISGLAMQEPNFAGDTVEECAEWHVLGAWNLLHELTAMGAVA